MTAVPARSCPSAPREGTVLVVDADVVVRTDVARALAGRFDRVMEAGSAEIALYLCTAHAVDLVASSARLPGLGADVLCAELRERGGPPVLAYRTGAAASAQARWLDAGGADCLAGDDPVLVAARCRAVARRSSRPTAGRGGDGR